MNCSLAEQLVNVALETIDSVSEVVLTVVLAVYLLLDGNDSGTACLSACPRFSFTVQQSLQQNFQNYFLGQVALLVGLSMTLAFLALRVPFGLLFGLGWDYDSNSLWGCLEFSLVGLLVASHDFWLGVKTLLVAVVVDQVIDQVIAPLLGRLQGSVQ